MGTGAPHWPRWPRHRWAQHTFKSASAAMSIGPRRASIRPALPLPVRLSPCTYRSGEFDEEGRERGWGRCEQVKCLGVSHTCLVHVAR